MSTMLVTYCKYELPGTFFYGFGHEALVAVCALMNAGGYKFNDFVRVGTPLTLLMWLVLTAVLAFAYNL
jgi:hypothetical protein